jgi:hypothetical protein
LKTLKQPSGEVFSLMRYLNAPTVLVLICREAKL